MPSQTELIVHPATTSIVRNALPPDWEVLAYIGEHFTENHPDITTWQKLVYHLFRSASEQRGIEFADRVKFMLIRGNATKRGTVLTIFNNATAAVRNHIQYIASYEPDVPDEVVDDPDELES